MSAYLRQSGVPDHQSFGLLKARITFCYHIHRLLPNELQSIQTTCYHCFTLWRGGDTGEPFVKIKSSLQLSIFNMNLQNSTYALYIYIYTVKIWGFRDYSTYDQEALGCEPNVDGRPLYQLRHCCPLVMKVLCFLLSKLGPRWWTVWNLVNYTEAFVLLIVTVFLKMWDSIYPGTKSIRAQVLFCLLCSGRRWWAMTTFPLHFPPLTIRLPLLCPSHCWRHLDKKKTYKSFFVVKVLHTMRKYVMLCIIATKSSVLYTGHNITSYPAVAVLPPPVLTAQLGWEFPAMSQPSLSPEWALGLDTWDIQCVWDV